MAVRTKALKIGLCAYAMGELESQLTDGPVELCIQDRHNDNPEAPRKISFSITNVKIDNPEDENVHIDLSNQ